jgi:hypothetical protein
MATALRSMVPIASSRRTLLNALLITAAIRSR